jgi:hypothetical protein
MRPILGVFLAMQIMAASAAAAEWGDLHLRFKYDGEPPEPRTWVADKDVAVCGKTKLFDESLLVDKETRGIANVVVMLLKPVDGEVPVHELYEKTAKEPAKIVSRNCRFEPHVLVMRTTQPLILDNPDPIGHVPRLELFSNPPTSALMSAGGPIRLDLRNEESSPVRLECSIHAWMSAYVIVRGNPYATASNKQGHVTLKNVPAGEWNFRIWQERAANLKQVRQGDKTLKWPKGRVKLTIKPGENDLGEILIPADAFNRR